MNDLEQTLFSHEVQNKESCVSWGLELIAKLHGEIPSGDYPIQSTHPTGLGFGHDGQSVLRKYHIMGQEHFVTFEEFKVLCERESVAGFHPIVSLVTIAELIFEPFGFAVSKHVFCVSTHQGRLYCHTRAFGYPDVFPFSTPQMKRLYEKAEKGVRF